MGFNSGFKGLMLTMSPAWINARMDMSEHGLSHPFNGPRADGNGLTGIKNVSAKCLFFLIGTEYTRVSVCPRWQKYEGLRSGERGGCNSKTVCRQRSSSDLVLSYAHRKKKYTELQYCHTRIINDRGYNWHLCHFACSSAVASTALSEVSHGYFGISLGTPTHIRQWRL